MNGMVGCLVMELSELCHGGLLSNFAKSFEPSFETVGLGKGSPNNVGVEIMKHCHAQDVHVRIRVNRGWVIVVVAHAGRVCMVPSLKVPSEYDLLLKLTFVMRGGSGTHVEQRRPSIVVDPRTTALILAASLSLTGFFGIVIYYQYQRDKEGGQGVQLVKWAVVVFRELECVYFVNGSRHFCSLVGEVIKGCIALHSIYTLVFTVVNDFNDVVVVWLLRLKVDTGKFCRDVGMGNV